MTWADWTWMDWSIVAVVLFSLLLGLRRGALTGILSILGLVCALIAASVWYPSLAELAVLSLRLDKAWAATGAFLVLTAAVYVVVGVAATILLSVHRMSMSGHVIGGVVGAAKGGVLAAVLLAIALASPVGATIRRDLGRSHVAPPVVQGYQVAVKKLSTILPPAIHLPDADKVRF